MDSIQKQQGFRAAHIARTSDTRGSLPPAVPSMRYLRISLRCRSAAPVTPSVRAPASIGPVDRGCVWPVSALRGAAWRRGRLAFGAAVSSRSVPTSDVSSFTAASRRCTSTPCPPRRLSRH
eukprot:2892102-Pleurochrysis_carterae.AAC.3